MATSAIKAVFILVGTLLLSCLVWWYVQIGPLQEQMWQTSNRFFLNEWSNRTGNDGTWTWTSTRSAWENANDYTVY